MDVLPPRMVGSRSGANGYKHIEPLPTAATNRWPYVSRACYPPVRSVTRLSMAAAFCAECGISDDAVGVARGNVHADVVLALTPWRSFAGGLEP